LTYERVQHPVVPSLITTPDIGDDYLDADAYNEHSKLFNIPPQKIVCHRLKYITLF